jgi:hypothetical protein
MAPSCNRVATHHKYARVAQTLLATHLAQDHLARQAGGMYIDQNEVGRGENQSSLSLVPVRENLSLIAYILQRSLKQFRYRPLVLNHQGKWNSYLASSQNCVSASYNLNPSHSGEFFLSLCRFSTSQCKRLYCSPVD